MARTVRFWAFVRDGFVRLTLREGAPLAWGRSGRTEEGWEREAVTWALEGGNVIRETYSDGADCDGRLSSHDTCVCPVDALASYAPPADLGAPGPLPSWDRVDSRRRDYAAEAAGY